MESTSTWLVKYDKFWRFGFKSILQNSSVQKILLPRRNGSSLQFQVKEQPAAAEAVAKEEIEEVGGSGTIGAGFEERLWSILEVGPLEWPFGNPCDNVTASSLPFDSGCCHRNLSRLQPRQFFQPLWLEVEVLSWTSWNVSKMNLDDKWTRTDLTDQIAKLRELKFFHGVACESKHGWCVRHLKQPPHQLNTTSFEDSGLNPFYNNLWYKGFFFRDKIGSSLQFQAKEKPAGGERCGRDRGGGGKWHDWCEVWRMTLEHFGTIGRLSMWQHQVCPVCPLSRDVATETWGASNPVNLSNHSG